MSSDQQYPYHGAHGGGHRDGPQDGPVDQGVSQTWEGQTWDTHYQPAVPPQQTGPATGAYLPPQQTGPAPAAYDAPTAYLPPVADPAPAHPGHGSPVYAPGPAQPAPDGYGADPYRRGHGPEGGAAGYGAAAHPAGAAQAGYGPDPYAPGPGPAGDAPAGYGPDPYAAEPGHTDPSPAGPAGPSPYPPAPETAQGGPGPAYGAPTTLGNARVTDAQRARAEGRSPIIAPGIQPAGLTVLLGVLLAAGAAVGPYALLVPVVLLQAVTAAGWFRLNGMWPARQGIALAFLGGVVADAVLLAAGREHAPAAILGTLGVWVLLVLVLQLRSHAAPEERMYGLMATVASSALAVVCAGFLAAGSDAPFVGALAVAAATAARALPLPGPGSLAAALLAAAGAGVAAGTAVGTGTGLVSAGLGLVAGACALIGLRVASYDYPSRFVHMTAGVALPLALAAPVLYLLGRALG
ncbi:hypothetical protein BJP40_24740 [Streptomyces sp. CC53]|uniref:hypothetical protein n=1 Tax=unclassified Streptomyces TaxID=2593676 RepID=UPI0008DDFFE0|nr:MULTISPECIES: hypothetical protein [unclassified Streptomyces]OII63220.1 hypothetical protein BJP40_24740 [Streptomyces sp. CC53]